MIVSYWTALGSHRGGRTRPRSVSRCRVLMPASSSGTGPAPMMRRTRPIVRGFGSIQQGRSIGMNEKPRMDKAVEQFAEQLHGIRSGTVSIGLIEAVRVPVQGNLVPINRLGNARMQGDRILIAP